jgi:hypothetical protein
MQQKMLVLTCMQKPHLHLITAYPVTGICQLFFSDCWRSIFPLCHHRWSQNCSCDSATVLLMSSCDIYFGHYVRGVSVRLFNILEHFPPQWRVILIQAFWRRVVGRNICYLGLNFCHEVFIEVMLLLVVLWVVMQLVLVFHS